jgi:hypothetical protein
MIDESGSGLFSLADVQSLVAGRMLSHCNGVLRISGASSGADGDVRLAGELGLPVYYELAEIPAP